MTVENLITELQKYPKDMKVLRWDSEECEFVDIDSTDTINTVEKAHSGGYISDITGETKVVVW